MGRLVLRLLGTPEVSHAGRILTFPTRKVLALLVYLAVERKAHARDKITALFWPESDEERGKGSLRRALVYVRDLLEESSSHHPGDSPLQAPHVLIEHDLLSFNTAADFELDLDTLEKVFSFARRSSSGTAADLRAQLAQLQSALALYRGDFLEGFSLPDASDFEDWLLLQRETWHRRTSALFDRLSHLQTEGGELEQALDTTTRWIVHDSLNEAAHTRLIQLHYALGDRSAALQAYERCRAVLERELRTEPAPSTLALADSIRAQAPPTYQQDVQDSFSARVTLRLPLIGRTTEHTTLITAYRSARRGRIQAVTLEGEPGIGKTRLAQEFLRWARMQGADVLQGRAFETKSGLPYQPLIEALRSRLEAEKDPRALLSDTWLTELSRLLPELEERCPALPAPLSLGEADARTRLFEAVSRLGQSFAKQDPVVLFIDDAQWADAASLDVVLYAARRWAMARLPVLLLVALRSEDLTTNSWLSQWLANLEHDLPLTRLALAPLTFEDTLRLVQSLVRGKRHIADNASGAVSTIEAGHHTPRSLPDGIETLSRHLFTETGGQPFFLIETLKSFTQDGDLQVDEAGVAATDLVRAAEQYTAQHHLLPTSVRILIQARLTHLSPDAHALCTAGAILGAGFGFDHVCNVAEIGERQGLAALGELLRRGLLREAGGRCYFTHDKIREVAYAEVDAVRRRILHGRAYETLEKAEAPCAERAWHAHAAGLFERAFQLSILAGDEALSLFAVQDAVGHYERARALLTNLKPAQLAPSVLRHLYAHLGRALQLVNEGEKARTAYEEMLSLARKLQATQMVCTALNALATLALQHLGQEETVEALLHEALALARASGERVSLLETEWNLSQLAVNRLDREAALTHGVQALALSRELDAKGDIARSLNQLAFIEHPWCRWTQVAGYAEEARRLYAELGDRAMEVDSMLFLADAQIRTGKPQEGIAITRRAIAISSEIENAWGMAHSAYRLALGLLERAEYGEALEIAQTGVAQARAAGHPPLLVLNLATLGSIYRALFALDAAYAPHSEARALSETLQHPFFIEVVLAELCADAAVAGRWQEAYEVTQQILAIRNYAMPYVGLTRWYETEALLHGGANEQAAEDVGRFGRGLDHMDHNRRYRIAYLRALAALTQYAGEIEQAIAHLQEAANLAEEIGLPGELWSILAAQGELYLKQGDQERARPAFGRAAAIVQKLADTIRDQEQRVSFLEANQVRRVFVLGVASEGHRNEQVR